MHIIPINDQWVFCPKWAASLTSAPSAGESIHLPHTVKEVPLHYADETQFWFVSGYQRTITWDAFWADKQVLLHFEGVMCNAEVFINGVSFGEHKGGYTPWTLDITKNLKQGDNLLTVKVDSTERPDTPPFGGQIDYLCFGGIYREVELRIVPQLSVEALLLSQKDALTAPKVTGKVRIRNAKAEKGSRQLALKVEKDGKNYGEHTLSFNLDGSLFQDIPAQFEVQGVSLWDIDSPILYSLSASFNGEVYSTHIGFREALFTPEGFLLNGKPLKLRGLNRHQSYPFMGYAAPARLQRKDADILKYDLALNLVRTSHYPQSRHFLDRCDEIGLLVFEEMPGWQHIGDKAWQEVSVQNVKDMVERDISRPSIILWGVRINESLDNHDFYSATNAMARSCDPTRQTGGVRWVENGEFLEDVYTHNDFVQNHEREALRGQKEVTKRSDYIPYMVTEYNGHMYPVKSWDQEERQIEHTRRHFNVIASSASDPHICGTIGWCAFDYHTHKDFGSGDRICYHGVCDIFRIPKFAAYAYSTQINPETKIILKPLTLWARGERSIGGIIPLMVATNCDYIKVYYGDVCLGEFYPAEGRYRGLKHPPMITEDRKLSLDSGVFETAWGMRWDGGLIEGYYKGKKVAECVMPNNPLPQLSIASDDKALNFPQKGEAWDSTRVVVSAKDQHGNPIPYINAALHIRVEGGALIGDTLASMEGGVYAFWVKTASKKEQIRIFVESPYGTLQHSIGVL